MIWSRAKLSPEVRLLLDRERSIAVLPAAARARALSRARAALAAGVATRPIPSRAPSAARWAAAAGLVCVATVTVGAAAYEVGLRERPTVAVAATPRADTATLQPSVARWPVGDLPATPTHAGSSAISRDRAAGEELRLLQQARVAVAREDFIDAKRLLAEHARRFKTGRLTEEREALQVRALAGLGRREDARRAAADFEARFPRSPLLLTISQMPDSAP